VSACSDPGAVIGGKYELVKLLGRGSMGEVWCARHRTLDELVAVKLLAHSFEDGAFEAPANAAARFRLEAQLAARLSRKTRHIVRVTDHGEDHGVAYLVMELLEGETLEARLLRRPKLPVGEVADLVAQMCRALVVAHEEGIVHRDLKPANVFLASDEDGRTLVKLLDFGIARTMYPRRVAQSFATGDGLVFGTPGYMSPEQARAADPDARCDLWALATVAYQALTGDLPVPGATTEEMFANLHAFRVIAVHERAPELSAEFGPFFQRAFAPRMADRHASAAELGAAFASACCAQVPVAAEAGAAPVTRPWARDARLDRRVSLSAQTLRIADPSSRSAPPAQSPPARRTARPIVGPTVAVAGCLLLGVGVATVSRAGALRPGPGVTEAQPGVRAGNIATGAPPVPGQLAGSRRSPAGAAVAQSSSAARGIASAPASERLERPSSSEASVGSSSAARDPDVAAAGTRPSSSGPNTRGTSSSASVGIPPSAGAAAVSPAARPRPAPRDRSDVL
jgi:serine/threonine-protein kinase